MKRSLVLLCALGLLVSGCARQEPKRVDRKPEASVATRTADATAVTEGSRDLRDAVESGGLAIEVRSPETVRRKRQAEFVVTARNDTDHELILGGPGGRTFAMHFVGPTNISIGPVESHSPPPLSGYVLEPGQSYVETFTFGFYRSGTYAVRARLPRTASGLTATQTLTVVP